MTSLRCVCGTVVGGVEENLLEAVEQHVREHHAPPQSVTPHVTPAEALIGRCDMTDTHDNGIEGAAR